MKKIVAVLVLIMFLTVSGCATFSGNELPLQQVKPKPISNVCFVTGDINLCPLPMDALDFKQHLQQIIVESGGTCQIPAKFNEALAEKVEPFKALLEYEKRKIMHDLEVLDLGAEILAEEKAGAKIITASDYMTSEQLDWAYQQRIERELLIRMRTDLEFRKQILPLGMLWFDYRTSITDGNPFLLAQTLLSSCTLLIFPAYNKNNIDISVAVYDMNSKISEHEYKDSYKCYGWLPLFLYSFKQSWPDIKTIASVMKNMALTAVLDFQKDQANE